MAKKKPSQIAGQWVSRPRQLTESPAMRVLSKVAHLALMRIEVEHMSHGGAQNGRLPITYIQFEDWGIHPNYVASALRELPALGIVEVTRTGYAGAADKREPSLYRLTYLTAHDAGRADATGTHEYLRIKTVREAKAIAKAARDAADPRNVERGKKHFATLTKCEISPSQSEGTNPTSRPHKVRVHVHPHKVRVLSISREEILPPPSLAPPPADDAPPSPTRNPVTRRRRASAPP
jgi:hypothetical protein